MKSSSEWEPTHITGRFCFEAVGTQSIRGLYGRGPSAYCLHAMLETLLNRQKPLLNILCGQGLREYRRLSHYYWYCHQGTTMLEEFGRLREVVTGLAR